MTYDHHLFQLAFRRYQMHGGVRKTARAVDVSPSTISRWIRGSNWVASTKRCARKKRTRKNSKLTPDVCKAVLDFFMDPVYQCTTARVCAHTIQSTLGQIISMSSLRRCIRKVGLSRKRLSGMPRVREDHLDAVEQFNAERLKAVKRRRFGIPFDGPGANENTGGSEVGETKNKKKSEARYPEVRGLRFCPERRLYLDRDRESAVAIARLRTLELLGKPRPAPFVKGFKTPTIKNSNQLASVKAGEKGRRTRTLSAPTK